MLLCVLYCDHRALHVLTPAFPTRRAFDLPARGREVFRTAALTGSAIMFGLTLVCQWRPEWFIGGFTDEPEVIAIGGQFLHIISWNFVASGLVFTCSDRKSTRLNSSH